MKKNNFGVDLLKKTKTNYTPIIILSAFSIIYQLIRYDFELIKSFVSALVIFVFATFISFMYSIFLNLYKPTPFLIKWWQIYGFMIFAGVIVNWINLE
ncbi:hypothetical protein [Urechidicola croceus]|uniref:Uncharacterized protein n=1 Tax=Urechidicola croceus TaxID=1850246 RepID=A0A1D8P450_9FLAO|nr:hypothetical protein [Urechidicola croceus]AOW19360.1 hypothetical protein LPB138_01080 [Urechidicola croceus]AOW19392.1 hypothetical protein LPB138_01250 [Urechidicola croceus]